MLGEGRRDVGASTAAPRHAERDAMKRALLVGIDEYDHVDRLWRV
jgi:uncharacterized caspase-like protein